MAMRRLKEQIASLREQNQQLAVCHSGAQAQCPWDESSTNAPATHQTCSALLEATRNITQMQNGKDDREVPHEHWTVLGTFSRLLAAIFLLGTPRLSDVGCLA